MNFGEMIDRVQLTLGMNETVSNDESLLIKAWINEGMINVISRTRPYTRSINMTVQPDTPEHDMSSTIIALVDIVLPGQGKVNRFTRTDILDLQQVGALGYAYEEPLFWFSPIVSEPTVIKAYGIFRPIPMTADSHNPASATYGGLAEEFHPVVLDYVLWKAGEYVQHQESQSGEKWRVAYEGQDGFGGGIAQMKRILTKRVTPAAARRRNLAQNLGTLSSSMEYIGG